MPIYEYKCENGHLFETMQKFSDDPLAECEVCGAPVQRVLHSPAIHFKGSGFHNTDYGTKKKPLGGEGGSEGSSDSGSSDSGSSDSGSSSDSSSSDSKTSDSKSSGTSEKAGTSSASKD